MSGTVATVEDWTPALSKGGSMTRSSRQRAAAHGGDACDGEDDESFKCHLEFVVTENEMSSLRTPCKSGFVRAASWS